MGRTMDRIMYIMFHRYDSCLQTLTGHGFSASVILRSYTGFLLYG